MRAATTPVVVGDPRGRGRVGHATALVAAGSLVAGFAVAEATGVRALGGGVLLVAVAWCARAWHRRGGARRAALLTVAYLAAFVGSHLLARAVGAWPAVLLAAAAVGALALAVDRGPAARP
jgi:hypothetical protein